MEAACKLPVPQFLPAVAGAGRRVQISEWHGVLVLSACRMLLNASMALSHSLRYGILCADKHGAFVQPAVYEAFGLTVIEAMSCGLPTFATIKGGPAEVQLPSSIPCLQAQQPHYCHCHIYFCMAPNLTPVPLGNP